MDFLTITSTVAGEPKLPLVAVNEVEETSSVSDSEVKNEESQYGQQTAPAEHIRTSGENADPADKVKPSPMSPLSRLDEILEEVKDWRDRLELLEDFAIKKRTTLQREAQTKIRRVSMPQVNYVSWATMKGYGCGTVPPVHCAIDIPIGEPTVSELDAFARKQNNFKPVDQIDPNLIPPKKLFREKGVA